MVCFAFTEVGIPQTITNDETFRSLSNPLLGEAPQ